MAGRIPKRRSVDYTREVRGLEPTDRQIEVLYTLLDRSEADAAKTLGISVQTIKGHMQALYARVGAYNRGHAVYLCYVRLKELEFAKPERRVGLMERRRR